RCSSTAVRKSEGGLKRLLVCFIASIRARLRELTLEGVEACAQFTQLGGGLRGRGLGRVARQRPGQTRCGGAAEKFLDGLERAEGFRARAADAFAEVLVRAQIEIEGEPEVAGENLLLRAAAGD